LPLKPRIVDVPLRVLLGEGEEFEVVGHMSLLTVTEQTVLCWGRSSPKDPVRRSPSWKSQHLNTCSDSGSFID
jgi:hypothetical protein